MNGTADSAAKTEKIFRLRKILILIGVIAWLISVISFGVILKGLCPSDGFLISPDPKEAKGFVYEVEFTLAFIYLILTSISFLEYQHAEIPVKKTFFKGLSLLFISSTILQTLSLCESLARHLDIADPLFGRILGLGLNVLIVLIVIILLLGIMPLVDSVDRLILKRGHLLRNVSIIGSSASVILLVGVFIEVPLVLGYILIITGMLVLLLEMTSLPLVYFKIARDTVGSLKRSAYFIGFGYLLTFLGVVLHILRSNFPPFAFNYLVFLIVNVVGVILLIVGYSNIE